MSDDALLLAASSTVCEDTPLMFSINKKPPRMYSNFVERVRNYVNDEALTLKKSGAVKTFRGNPEGDRQKEMKRPVENPAGASR